MAKAALVVERAFYGGVCLAAGYSGHRLNPDKEAGYTGPQELQRSDRFRGHIWGTYTRRQTQSDAKGPVVFLKKSGEIEPDATRRKTLWRT